MKKGEFLQDAMGLIDEEIIADAKAAETKLTETAGAETKFAETASVKTKAAETVGIETKAAENMRRKQAKDITNRKTARHIWSAIAACAAVLLLVILGLPQLSALELPSKESAAETDENGRLLWSDTRKTNGKTSATAELAIIWPWELETVFEQYTSVTFADITYRTRASAISESLLGEELGSCVAVGYDIYEDKTHQETFAIRAIEGISPDLLVAVKLDESYCVFMNDTYDPPATLGEFIDAYQLSSSLPLTGFYDEENSTKHTSQGYYALSAECSADIWTMLEAYGDTLCTDTDSYTFVKTEYVSFSASSEVLGITNKTFRITASGYVWTNICEWGYSFYIGEAAAAEIIAYARANSAVAEPQRTSWLVGTITEIGEDYIKVDDSVMMKNPEDGITFTVVMEDIQLKRYILRGTLSVGQTVVVEYDGKIYADNPYVIENAFGIDTAYITSSGEVLIPE